MRRSQQFCNMLRHILNNEPLPTVEKDFPEEDMLFFDDAVEVQYASILHRTDLAVLFLIDGDVEPREVWMPLSVVRIGVKSFTTYRSFWRLKNA